MAPDSTTTTLGSPGVWSRDLAIVGATTTFFSLYTIDWRLRPSMFVAAAIGALVGAIFGITFRRLLLRSLHVPIVAWIPISLMLGALWGGAVGLLAASITVGFDGALVVTGFGAIAGALQLSWFWLPYTVRTGRGKSTWPLVTAAAILGTVVGYAALWLLLVIWRPAFD